jgi:hypothetical protein
MKLFHLKVLMLKIMLRHPENYLSAIERFDFNIHDRKLQIERSAKEFHSIIRLGRVPQKRLLLNPNRVKGRRGKLLSGITPERPQLVSFSLLRAA